MRDWERDEAYLWRIVEKIIRSLPTDAYGVSGGGFVSASSVSNSQEITFTTDIDDGEGSTGQVTVGGDLLGVASNATVTGLRGNPVGTATPTSDQVLTWDGSSWSPAAGGQTSEATIEGYGFTRELLMQDGVTAPPVPIETEAQDDWLYQD